MDPIADMLTRIRNAQKAGHKTVSIPASGIKFEIVRILKDEGYVGDIKKIGKGTEKAIVIELKEPPAIREIKRISRPGQRIYRGALELKRVKSGYGVAIISTPKGLMTNEEARKANLGGEVLLEIW